MNLKKMELKNTPRVVFTFLESLPSFVLLLTITLPRNRADFYYEGESIGSA